MIMKICAFLGMMVGVGFVAQEANSGRAVTSEIMMVAAAWSVIVFIVLAVYCLPIYIAAGRGHPQLMPITILSLVGGFFAGIPWLIAIVWAFAHFKVETDPGTS